MNQNHGFIDRLTRLKQLSGDVIAALESGEFYRLSYSERRRRIREIKRLYNRLLSSRNSHELRAVLAASALVVTASSCAIFFPDETGRVVDGKAGPSWEALGASDAPSFTPHPSNPTPLGIVANPNGFTLADVDGDGDLDAFFVQYVGYADYRVYSQVNTGSPTAPAFAAAAEPAYSIASLDQFYDEAVFLFDIDADGDLDLFRGGNNDKLVFSQNYQDSVGTPDFDEGTPLANNPMGIPAYVGNYRRFAAGDLDGDGDYDLLMSMNVPAIGGRTLTLENTGTRTAPDFTGSSWTLLYDTDSVLIDVGYNPKPNLIDIDDDGDLDLTLHSNGGPHLYENIGSRTNFELQAAMFPAGIVNGYFNPDEVVFADIDADGDLDVFVLYYGEGITDIFYNESTP